MTLLTVAQEASKQLPIKVPDEVLTSTDPNFTLLGRLANKVGKSLVRRHSWQKITKEKTFTSVAAETQTNAVPDDFDHICNETFFNRSQIRRVVGPLTPEEWQAQKAITASVLRDAYRFRGGDILIIPTPAAGDTMAYEYVSNQWVDTDSDGLGNASSYTLDTHVSLIDEELITLGVVWSFLRVKGLDYSEDFREFEMALADRKAKDKGKATIDFSGTGPSYRPGVPFIPEGNWNL